MDSFHSFVTLTRMIDKTATGFRDTERLRASTKPSPCSRAGLLAGILLLGACMGWSQQRRKVIINEDCSGPGGSNLQTVGLLIQSKSVEVLGITVVSGDQWRDEEVAHTLRLLEILGRTDIPGDERRGVSAGTQSRRDATVAGTLRKSVLRRRLGRSLVA